MSILKTLARGGIGFLTGGPVGAGLGVASSLLSRGGGSGNAGAGGDEGYYGTQFQSAVSGLGTRANDAESRYLTDLNGFDPEAAFSAKTTADLDSYDEDFARKYGDQVAHQVGNGRSPVTNGFGLRSVQDTIRTGMADRSRIRQQNSDALAGLQLQKLGMQGNYATSSRGLYLDAVGGRLNTLEGDRMQNDASKRGLWGSLLGAAASGAGAYFGNQR